MYNICKTCSIWWETLQMIIYWFWGFPAWFWYVLSCFWWVPSWLSFSCRITYKSFLLKKCNPVHNILRKIKKSSKVRQKKKKWYLFLRTVWEVVPEIYFCRRDCAGDWVPINFFNFPDISLLCKILSLKSYGNRWAKSYVQFVLLGMKFILLWWIETALKFCKILKYQKNVILSVFSLKMIRSSENLTQNGILSQIRMIYQRLLPPTMI